MPVKTSNNNRILPGNARAADVATKAIQEILPTQQMRYHSAFRVQGFEGVLYNRLYQGPKCTCKSTQKHLASRLDESGKARPGVINELMVGQVFDVSAYGHSGPRNDPFDSIVSPHAPVNKHQGVFDNVSRDPTSLPARIVDEDFGDNGPVSVEFDIDTLAADFDANAPGMTEASCAVCFGSGFVGGYAPLYGKRIVRTVDQVELASTDVIDPARTPWVATTQKFKFTEVLPFGAVALDAFRVLLDHRPLPANFTIDGNHVNEISVLKYCDGKSHLIEVLFSSEQTFTHVEIQFKTSTDNAFFEFPKLSKSSDISVLDNTEPFQIILSPLVPSVQVEDIFTDSTYGKALIVQSVNTWNTRNRQTLGWECQVRVAQTPEIYNYLPRRGRIQTKPQTSNMVHDNSTGYRRT
jgi:hypothetical protein